MPDPSPQIFERKTIIRADAILTTGYVAATEIKDCEKYNQLMLFIKYTKGSLTSMQIKLEFSDDGVNYYQETFSTISTTTSTEVVGEHSFTTAGNANFILAIPIKCAYVKVSVKGTGTVTSSALQVRSALAVA